MFKLRILIESSEYTRQAVLTLDILLRGAQKLGYHLTQYQLDCFQKYQALLENWNAVISLTSIDSPKDVQLKHFLDSIAASVSIEKETLEYGSLLDVGSGAGFPGIPLKIMWPGLKVTLIESTRKKADFLRFVSQSLGLSELTICNDRSESAAHAPNMRESFDVVVARAIAKLSTLAELTIPFCKVGGKVIAYKNVGITNEIDEALEALAVLGATYQETRAIDLEGLEGQRCIVILSKDFPTDNMYPRRPGIPSKRPLTSRFKQPSGSTRST